MIISQQQNEENPKTSTDSNDIATADDMQNNEEKAKSSHRAGDPQGATASNNASIETSNSASTAEEGNHGETKTTKSKKNNKKKRRDRSSYYHDSRNSSALHPSMVPKQAEFCRDTGISGGRIKPILVSNNNNNTAYVRRPSVTEFNANSPILLKKSSNSTTHLEERRSLLSVSNNEASSSRRLNLINNSQVPEPRIAPRVVLLGEDRRQKNLTFKEPLESSGRECCEAHKSGRDNGEEYNEQDLAGIREMDNEYEYLYDFTGEELDRIERRSRRSPPKEEIMGSEFYYLSRQPKVTAIFPCDNTTNGRECDSNKIRQHLKEYEHGLTQISLAIQLPYTDNVGNAITSAFQVSETKDYMEMLAVVESEKIEHGRLSMRSKTTKVAVAQVEKLGKIQESSLGIVENVEESSLEIVQKVKKPSLGKVKKLKKLPLGDVKKETVFGRVQKDEALALVQLKKDEEERLVPGEIRKQVRITAEEQNEEYDAKGELLRGEEERENGIAKGDLSRKELIAKKALQEKEGPQVMEVQREERTAKTEVQREERVAGDEEIPPSKRGEEGTSNNPVSDHPRRQSSREGASLQASNSSTHLPDFSISLVEVNSKNGLVPDHQTDFSSLSSNSYHTVREVAVSDSIPSENADSESICNLEEDCKNETKSCSSDPTCLVNLIQSTSTRSVISSLGRVGGNKKYEANSPDSADSVRQAIMGGCSQSGTPANRCEGKSRWRKVDSLVMSQGKAGERKDEEEEMSGSVKLENIRIRPASIHKMLLLQREILSQPDKYNDPNRFDAFDLVELDYESMKRYLTLLVYHSLLRDQQERRAKRNGSTATATSDLKTGLVCSSKPQEDEHSSSSVCEENGVKGLCGRIKSFFRLTLKNPVSFCSRQKSSVSPASEQDIDEDIEPSDGTGSSEGDEATTNTTTTGESYRRRKLLQCEIEGRDVTDSESSYGTYDPTSCDSSKVAASVPRNETTTAGGALFLKSDDDRNRNVGKTWGEVYLSSSAARELPSKDSVRPLILPGVNMTDMMNIRTKDAFMVTQTTVHIAESNDDNV